MQKVYLNFPSITFALKSDKILQKNHINSILVKTPSQFSSCGCGHSIIINQNDLESARSLLQNNNIILNDIQVLKE